MRNDPIVEETRRIRDEMAARFDYDVRRLGQYYMSQRQREKGHKIVKRPPKRIRAETDHAAQIDQGPTPVMQAGGSACRTALRL
jgi:hypothetical protein